MEKVYITKPFYSTQLRTKPEHSFPTYLHSRAYITVEYPKQIQIPCYQTCNMIRMIPSLSANQAKDYFNEALLKADYYINDQELNGEFQGKLAQRLGLNGTATKDGFYALVDNLHPQTGKPLTPRTKDDRTTGYDINFHCPKSVSILHALSNDEHIFTAFKSSVRETMLDIEADSKTRVRRKGASTDRATGELAWVDFIHQTARPVDGHDPDPHLHAHCYVFNMTYDGQEERIKAGQFRDINRDMPYYQALFHKRFSDKLIARGYQIRNTDKAFEIEGVPQPVVDLFSKRTDEIGRIAKEKGIQEASALAELGARTRAKKQKGSSMSELRNSWKNQIAALGDVGDGPIRFAKGKAKEPIQPDKCVDFAIHHSFERASVMPYRRVLEAAYKHGIGSADVTAAAIAERLQNDKRLITIQERGQLFCTTKEVLKEEQQMVQLARNGIGKITPLYDYEPVLNLKEQQAAAVHHVLTTNNRVSIIRGAAGTGKTTLMPVAVEMIEKKGKQVTVVAPSSRASRGELRKEGFAEADTVAMLLLDKEKQQKLKGQVLWVDEAGLLGTKDMSRILELATQQNAQVILGGDTRQHAAVVRGDALRILNTVGGIKTAEVNKIYRQRDQQYREAVAELSKGEVKAGFDKLDAIGAIRKVDPLKPNTELVEDYVKAVKDGKSTLVISPTHKQGDEVTEAIRKELRKEGLIGKKEIAVQKFNSCNLTEAQKKDWRNYSKGQFIQFSQNVPGIKRGSLWTVDDTTDKAVQLKSKDGESVLLPLEQPTRFEVYQTSSINLSKGDKVQITRNGWDNDKKRLDNGDEYEVAKINKQGKMVLQNKVSKATRSLDNDYGHISHAHCITSHASQGKTVDEVFISQPAGTFSATDAKQFYVSVSRGRDRATVYTDDKEKLLEYAADAGDRSSAMEMVSNKKMERHLDRVHYIERDNQTKDHSPKNDKDRSPSRNSPTISKDDAPGL